MSTKRGVETAREALKLAWDLAHPVRKGQVIPEGTEVLAQQNWMLWVYGRADCEQVATANDEANVRTLEPLGKEQAC